MSIKPFVPAVFEFNQTVLSIAPRKIGQFTPAEAEISIKCLTEEIQEYVTAVNHSDVVGAIDALIDFNYFAVGVLYKMGASVDEIAKWLLVFGKEHSQLMVGTEGYELHDSIDDISLAQRPEDLQELVKTELVELRQDFDEKEWIFAFERILRLIIESLTELHEMGLSHHEIARMGDAVHNANMQKKLGVVAKRAVEGAADAIKPEGWLPPEERIIAILEDRCK